LTENQSTVLKKTGSGTLKLSGVNSVSGAISHEGGVLEFGAAESFGAANTSATALNFKAGEIRYTGPEATVTKGLTIADYPTGVTNAFVFDVRNNLTLNGAINNTKGAPIKVGIGDLTVNFPVPGVYTVASGRGMAQFNGNPLQMNGIPSTGYSGFTVAEGGVTFKGTSAMEASLPYQTVVGAKIRQTNLTENASLTIDGCKATIGGSGEHLWVGYGISSGMPNKPELNVVNGGSAYLDALKTSGDAGAAVDSQINLSNRAYLNANWAIQFGAHGYANGKTTVRMSNSVMRCIGTGELSSGGPLDFVAGSGSVVTQTCSGGIRFVNNASGWMRFEGGSRLNYNMIKFENAAGANLLVQFNDGILQPNANNTTSRTVRATGLGIELLAGGVTVDMSSASKHTFTLPIRGAGDVVKTGAGELVLANGQENGVSGSQLTAQYTGMTEVRAGRLSVETNGVGSATRVKLLSAAELNLSGSPITLGTIEGDGMITNGTLTAVLKCSFTNDATQVASMATFANVATSGFKVDFGRTDLDPARVTGSKLAIAKVTGTTTPDVSAWRGQNMGKNIYVRFSIQNNTIYATFDFGGTRILFL
jgi:autotransporter-associated beta strand protein